MSSQPPPPTPPPPPPAPQAAPTKRPWWKRWWAVGAGLILMLAVIGTLTETPDAQDATSEAADAPTSPTASPTADPPTPSPTLTSTPTPDPEPVEVPDLTGVSRQDAIEAVRDAGLEANVEERDVTNQEQQDVVLEQRPPAGHELREGATVTMVVGGEYVWTEPIVLEGNGDDVIVDFEIPGGVPAVVTATAAGSSNFVVGTYDAAGQRLDLLFNAIAPYEGVNIVNLFDGETTSEIEVSAPAAWTLTFAPITSAPVLEQSASGQSDGILILPDGGAAGARVFHFTHTGGSGNVVVEAYGESRRDLLVNEIGETDVRARWPQDVFLVKVQAEGAWAIELLDR